jgi:hypothetical protein
VNIFEQKCEPYGEYIYSGRELVERIQNVYVPMCEINRGNSIRTFTRPEDRWFWFDRLYDAIEALEAR